MLVKRLPGPITITSASAIAASASSQARTSSGLSQTRSIPLVRAIRDWPSTSDAVAQGGVQDDRRRRGRDDLAAHRQDPVHPPDALLEVALLDGRHRRDQEVADRVAGQARSAPVLAREPVLEELAHQRLGVGQRDEAVADVADRRHTELVAQLARRSTVVGHRHDRGQVARVLLEAAQERREPVSAADARRSSGRGPGTASGRSARPAAGRRRPSGTGP